MPEISPRVMNMVRRRILEDPTVTNDVLFAEAIELEPDVRKLNLRQFNARYPLRVRRWELSERTKMLRPSGPLSRAASFAAEERQPREHSSTNGPPSDGLPFPSFEAAPLHVLESDVVPPRPEPPPLALVTESEEPDAAESAPPSEEMPVRRRRRRAPAPVVQFDVKAQVMQALLEWATAVGQAKSVPEVFAVLATVDQYVARLAEALELD